ncbi:hypothetical protein ERJ75_000990500 [Trypanosoma vivax]|nr:hypothetical protein TRVL_01106 [Trypanosoma vivax]KAH8611894.1 hypothetical protein ERJ75_000990500 [Trypanosoma vivax]
MPSAAQECKAPSRQEVESWLDRIDDITAAVQEILNEDPLEAARKREAREARRREVEASERREKVKMRYDPRYYSRFENDELIDALLREVDDGGRVKGKGSADESLYSRVERVSLDEAIRIKEEASRAVRSAEWERACELYSNAIALNVIDASLVRTLRNNRALIQLKLGRYVEAVEDASFVLQGEPANVKALLRRATALRHLHRPLDALRDAEAALRREPSSREASELMLWSKRAKEEHAYCASFQRLHEEESNRLARATEALKTVVGDLVDVSGRSIEGDGVAGRHGGGKIMLRAVKCLRYCLEVVRSHHRGASVLFVISGGVIPLTTLITHILDSNGGIVAVEKDRGVSDGAVVLLLSLRLLYLVLVSVEVCADEVKASTASKLAAGLAKMIKKSIDKASNTMNGSLRAEVLSNVLPNLLQALEGLAVRFAVEVHAECTSLLGMVWGEIKQSALLNHQALFFLCGLLEALLKERSVAAAMESELEEIAPRAIEVALSAESIQLKEVALSLAVRVSCINSVCTKRMSSPEFIVVLAKVMQGRYGGPQGTTTPRLEEGIFALIYNVFLQAESRSGYVEEWSKLCCSRAPQDLPLLSCEWRALRERVMLEGISVDKVTVSSKMMAVFSKFARHDEVLRSIMLGDEAVLWSLLQSSLALLNREDTHRDPCASEEDALGESERMRWGGALWELVEHASTSLASFYSQRLLPLDESLVVPDRVALLLQIVQLAGGQHLVAMGNAALIGSLVPPAGWTHGAACSGVDVLLAGLRLVRETLFTMEHEGHKGTVQCVHAQAAQKNLAIALSKCCAVESQRERLRELKGFETLHAVLERC